METSSVYRGRFAPSPTGPLHFGSLVAAVASYLDAKAAGGQWLVRIEDVDTPRTVPGASDAILRSLEAHALEWDGEVVYQSTRTGLYQEAFTRLADHVYPCACSRVTGLYPGTCRHGLPPGKAARAWRLRVPEDLTIHFEDRLLGSFDDQLATTCGDFVVLRADGIFAYQLAVVVDDAAQQITDIVRGDDLLDSTARQIYLHSLLGAAAHRPPRHLHVPVVRDLQGVKLSKQTGAPALDDSDPSDSLIRAFAFLGMNPPRHHISGLPPRQLLEWGRLHWQHRPADVR